MSGVGHHPHPQNEDQKKIGIFISVLAVVMAVVSAFAKAEANKMIVREVEASNGYAWYQAKRQRTYMNDLELKRIEIDLAGTVSDTQRRLLEEQRSKLKAKNAEYDAENKDILAQSEAKKRDAEHSGHKHHRFEYSEILLHTAVVLSSLTLLTELTLFFRLGIAATAVGLGLAVFAWTDKPHDPPPQTAAKPAATPAANPPPPAPAK